MSTQLHQIEQLSFFNQLEINKLNNKRLSSNITHINFSTKQITHPHQPLTTTAATTTVKKTTINKKSFLSAISDKENLLDPINPDKSVNSLTPEDITRITNYFFNKKQRFSINQHRDYIMFMLGVINFKRISDLLPLTIGDILNAQGEVSDVFYINEEKTKKRARMHITPLLKKDIEQYIDFRIKHARENNYEFTTQLPLLISRKKNVKKKDSEIAGVLSRTQAWRIMDNAQKALGIEYSIGTHTMRKTAATTAIESNPNDSTVSTRVQQALNHNSFNDTKRYIKQNVKEESSFYEACEEGIYKLVQNKE